MTRLTLKLLSRLIFVFLTILCFEKSAKSQIYTGGTMGVNYNDGYIIELAPQIGYKFKIFQAGAAPLFSYAEKQNKYALGGRIFSELTIYKETFIHAELEAVNVEVYGTNIDTRKWVLALPIGGGYRYEISKGVFAYGMILYNVLQNENSNTKNPIIRGGINYQL